MVAGVPVLGIVSRMLYRLQRGLRRVELTWLALIAAGVWLVGGVGAWLLESGRNDGLRTLEDALWWAVVTMTTVGYGDRVPETAAGRVLGAVLMVVGISSLGAFMGAMSSYLVERRLKGGMGLLSLTLRKHVLVCGWNSRGPTLVAELLHEEADRDLVVVADLERMPLERDRVFFVRGAPAAEETLRRAAADRAVAAILLAQGDGDAADANSVLTALTLRALNPALYMVGEVLCPGNEAHFRRAGVNEVVVGSRVTSRLLVRSALHRGVTHVIEELLTAHYGSEIYHLPVARAMTFREWSDWVGARGGIALGYLDAEGTRLNPPGDVPVLPGCQVVYVAPRPIVT